MKRKINLLIPLIIVCVFLNALKINAQLEFCSGNSGDPIFTETFGTGLTQGPPLAPGTTTYNFTAFTPFDGQYTIASSSAFFDWHNVADRTPNDTNGKYLIVNADFVAGEFFQRTVTGLCENTSYEFSSWLINLLPTTTACPNGGIPINVRFQIWDSSNTTLLASGDTGDLNATATPLWEQYGLVFKTVPGQTSVILKMINNGTGGCGNDLAIDDIVFKSCGDFIDVTDTQSANFTAICEDQGLTSVTMTANPDFSVFNSHFYQWQESVDAENWIDIVGATTNTYTTPLLNTTTFYRVKVAEDVINISNANCNVVSAIFDVIFVPVPNAPISNGNASFCSNAIGAISAQVPDNFTVNWYDAPIGGILLLENSTVFTPEISGTYYAEASSTLTSCISTSRTPVEAIIFEVFNVFDETIDLCEGTTTVLAATISNAAYEWSTGETTENITVDTPGVYTVTITDAQSCTDSRTITVNQLDVPIIDTIVSNNEAILISTINSGEFEYSLDGTSYQTNPVFDIVEGGLYTVFVRNKNNCPPVTREFVHFVIPKFFSPNGDSNNDTFRPQGLELLNLVQINIFDRYGKLLISSNSNSFEWNGTLNGQGLPESDYWFSIQTDSNLFKGHFSLIR